MKTALIAMSGGVDSSVAASRMVEAGYDCIGCTMKLYENQDLGLPPGRTCCALDDVSDARSVAYRLGIPFYVFNFQAEFRREVMDRFVDAYRSGRTPNPCIDCNRYLKFGRLHQRARELGRDYVVTGHYARILREEGRWKLKKALDPSKDQSYVLYNLSQEELSHTLFPLGELRKEETRAIAARAGFLNADKPDSQDICFVPDGDYAGAVERLSGEKSPPGPYRDLEGGQVLGQHRGIIRYTIGQHRGLGLSLPERRCVCRIDPEENAVYLGREADLYADTLETEPFHWIAGTLPGEPVRCQARIRYSQREQPATAWPLENGGVRLVFDQPQRAVTPGQAAVLYDGDEVLGGGVILRGLPPEREA